MGLLDRIRRARPPAEALGVLEPGERVTAWGRTSDGEVVLATQHGLRVPGTERVGWHEIHTARWDSGVLTLIVGVEVEPGVREDAPPWRYVLADPQGVPEEIRARVTRSVAYSTHHSLRDGGVRIVARRVPGRDGLEWAVRYDAGTTRDAEVDRQVADLLTAAREAMAPPPDL